MRKIILIIVFLFILTTQAFGAEFVLMGNNGKSKTCQILDNGYLCPGEKKVDVKNFKFLFFMPKEAVYKTITAYGGKNINYLQLNNGRRYENGDLVLDSPFIKKKKGIIVKNLQGVEDICELKKNGGYICNTKQQLFNPLLPENKSWSFYRSDLDLQDNKPCIGFPNGFQTDEKVYFVENFQDKFFPYVYFDNPDAFRYENNKKGYVLFADGLYIPGELPVVYENRIYEDWPEYSSYHIKGNYTDYAKEVGHYSHSYETVERSIIYIDDEAYTLLKYNNGTSALKKGRYWLK